MAQIREGRPVGSLEYLKSIGRSPLEYATCSKPVPGESVGCNMWGICPWHNGPFYKGCRITRETGVGVMSRETVLPCYDIVKTKPEVERNGGLFDIIADEGDSINVRVTKTEPNPTIGGPPIYRDDTEPMVVPSYVNDKRSLSLKQAEQLARERAKRKEAEMAERRARLEGFPIEPAEPKPSPSGGSGQSKGR